MNINSFLENCGFHDESFNIKDENLRIYSKKVLDENSVSFSLPLTKSGSAEFIVVFSIKKDDSLAISLNFKCFDNEHVTFHSTYSLNTDNLCQPAMLDWISRNLANFMCELKVKRVYLEQYVHAVIASTEANYLIMHGNTRQITFVDGEAAEIYNASPNSVLSSTIFDYVGNAEQDVTVDLQLCSEAIKDIKISYKTWGKDIGIVEHLYQTFHVNIP